LATKLHARRLGPTPGIIDEREKQIFTPWEGPYIMAKVLKLGTYKLSTMKGEVFTNAWNIDFVAVVLCIKLPYTKE